MWKLFIADIKMMFRNRQALFWSFMFPLMFTFIFGMFFGRDNTTVGTIAVINHSDAPLAETVNKSIRDSALFKISEIDDEARAKIEIDKNNLSGAVVIPEKFGLSEPGAPTNLKMIYDPANATTKAALSSLLGGILTQVGFESQNVKPMFGILEDTTNSRKLSYFDFVLVGLIGMALMNSSIQGIAISLSKYREDKILKRMTTTPLPTWKFILPELLSRLILNFIQVTFILLIGTRLFGAHIYGSYVLIYLFSLIGAILFQSVGFTVSALSKTTQAAEGMSTAVAIPMMFLAGVFFPIDQLPKWLYSIVQYLPLAPLLRIIRGIALEEASPFSNPRNLYIVGGWIIVLLFVSISRFRMSDE